ncbi:MAG: helix-turn-helix transcriptional regulator [Alphaproteobacteria bacterium]|nr:helix-turn-helix transcriptional regulator [Alphaproteobacteria bacterium]
MLSHKQIWGAIDALAARYGHSPSGLARAAGLDPTTFNKSKRLGPQGRLRWPSTESLSKVLHVTGASLDDFVSLVSKANGSRPPMRTVPFISMKDVQKKRVFDENGHPIAKVWDKFAFPDIGDERAFAIEISNDVAAPVFRNGHVVVVSPSAELRKGDPVVLKADPGCMVMRLARQTAKKLDLKSFNPSLDDLSLPREAIEWMARIVWVRH